MDEQTARGRERKKEKLARQKAKSVKYDACRDVGNNAERVFPQLGSRSLGGGLLERRRWSCCSKKESFERESSSICTVCPDSQSEKTRSNRGQEAGSALIDPNNNGEIRLIASSAVACFVTTTSSYEQLVPFGLKMQNKTTARAQHVYR